MTFAKVLIIAKQMMANMPQNHQAEMDGMAYMFCLGSDELGNGELSWNKMIVSIMQSEAVQTAACSAAAVFGADSAKGGTIVGRNNCWMPDDEADQWNALFLFYSGPKSFGGNGSLGELISTNFFSFHHLYAGSLDSCPSSVPLPVGTQARSPSIGLRYVMENCLALADAEEFLLQNGSYSQGSFTLLADAYTAHVFEYDTSRPSGQGERIRSAASQLIDPVHWRPTNAIASVNSYLLPSSHANHLSDPHNWLRVANFVKLYEDHLAKAPVGIDTDEADHGFHVRGREFTELGSHFPAGC